jgi:ADP-heptose:LPS heptosyltransferase
MKPDEQRHLLIMRLSAMGDVAMIVPVLKALRMDNPHLRITVMTREFFKPFFREIPEIEFFSPDLKGRHKGLRGIWRMYRDLSKLRVTRVADLHDVLRTKVLRVLFRLSGRKVSKIDKGRAEKRALTRKFRKFKVQLETTVERYRDAILKLGFTFAEPVPAEHTLRRIPAAIAEAAGEKHGVWVGVAPFAQHKGKIYPTGQLDSLVGLLAARYERLFVFGGGQFEKEFAKYLEDKYDRVVSVIGCMSLGEELDLISNMDVMLTMDSSSMHMASLVGVPAVSVWGATHPYAGFYGFGQDADNAVQLDLSCRPCSVYGNKKCMFGDYRCMRGITPESIAEKIEEVVAKAKPDTQS